MYISKPEASCQGKGIYLVTHYKELPEYEKQIVQEYIANPYLIDGLKFDLRLYVLLAGTNPLRIFLFNDGLVRFATHKYVKPNQSNLTDVYMHLTNFSINKNNEEFIFNDKAENEDKGHKRSLESVFKLLESQGVNTQEIWTRIKRLIIKTFCSAQPKLEQHYKSSQPDDHGCKMCFEILGFDIILDDKFNPLLLEINHTPSFQADTPLDLRIKKNVIKEALEIMNVRYQNRTEWKTQQQQMLQERMFGRKMIRITQEERNIKSEQASELRKEYEDKLLKNYERIYPLYGLEGKYEENFDELLKYSFLQYQYWVGVQREVKKPKVDPNPKNKKKKKKRKFDLSHPLYQQKTKVIIKKEEVKETKPKMQEKVPLKTYKLPVKRQPQVLRASKSVIELQLNKRLKVYHGIEVMEEEKSQQHQQLQQQQQYNKKQLIIKLTPEIKHPITGQILSQKQVETISDTIDTERKLCSKEKSEQEQLIDEIFEYHRKKADLISGTLKTKDQKTHHQYQFQKVQQQKSQDLLKKEFYQVLLKMEKKSRVNYLKHMRTQDLNEKRIVDWAKGFHGSQQKHKKKLDYFNYIRQKANQSQTSHILKEDDQILFQNCSTPTTLHSKRNYLLQQMVKANYQKKVPKITNLVYPQEMPDFSDMQIVQQSDAITQKQFKEMVELQKLQNKYRENNLRYTVYQSQEKPKKQNAFVQNWPVIQTKFLNNQVNRKRNNQTELDYYEKREGSVQSHYSKQLPTRESKKMYQGQSIMLQQDKFRSYKQQQQISNQYEWQNQPQYNYGMRRNKKNNPIQGVFKLSQQNSNYQPSQLQKNEGNGNQISKKQSLYKMAKNILEKPISGKSSNIKRKEQLQKDLLL